MAQQKLHMVGATLSASERATLEVIRKLCPATVTTHRLMLAAMRAGFAAFAEDPRLVTRHISKKPWG